MPNILLKAINESIEQLDKDEADYLDKSNNLSEGSTLIDINKQRRRNAIDAKEDAKAKRNRYMRGTKEYIYWDNKVKKLENDHREASKAVATQEYIDTKLNPKNENFIDLDAEISDYFYSIDEDIDINESDINSIYGIPSRKKFPLNNPDQVNLAIRYFNYAEPVDEMVLAKNIINALDTFNMPKPLLESSNRFDKYLMVTFHEDVNQEETKSDLAAKLASQRKQQADLERQMNDVKNNIVDTSNKIAKAPTDKQQNAQEIEKQMNKAVQNKLINNAASNIAKNMHESKHYIDIPTAFINEEISSDVVVEFLGESLKNNALKLLINFLSDAQLTKKLIDFKNKINSILNDDELANELNEIDFNKMNKSHKRNLLKKIIDRIDTHELEQANLKAQQEYENHIEKQNLKREKAQLDYNRHGFTKPQFVTLMSSIALSIIQPTLIIPSIALNIAYCFRNDRKYGMNEAYELTSKLIQNRIHSNVRFKQDIAGNSRELHAATSIDNNNAKTIAFNGETGDLIKYLLNPNVQNVTNTFDKEIADSIKGNTDVGRYLYIIRSQLIRPDSDVDLIKEAKTNIRKAYNNAVNNN